MMTMKKRGSSIMTKKMNGVLKWIKNIMIINLSVIGTAHQVLKRIEKAAKLMMTLM
jgi:hypothetical protein